MEHGHDPIATAQAGSYAAIEVRLLDRRSDIGEGLPAGLAGATVLRLAHCQVRTHRRTHFIRAQTDVWNPGMAAAPGMCGGVFTERGEGEFLVVSSWQSLTDHERYRNDRFPGLRRRSGAADDLDRISGDVVLVEPAWSVTT